MKGMNKMPKKLENEAIVNTLVEKLKGINGVQTIETQLLEPKLIRELYKVLGTPSEEDFPKEYEIAGRCWSKMRGYTTGISVMSERVMERENNQGTTYRVNRPSQLKRDIAREYEKAGWYCEIQAYNVICRKFVRHPRYENIWVFFYSSRDCNKYEYIIEDN